MKIGKKKNKKSSRDPLFIRTEEISGGARTGGKDFDSVSEVRKEKTDGADTGNEMDAKALDVLDGL